VPALATPLGLKRSGVAVPVVVPLELVCDAPLGLTFQPD